MEKTIKYLENGEYHYATVRSVGDLAQLKTTSKETLVEAINELWNGGGNVDPSKVPNPEGYDKLVQDVADAVKNQQEISQQWIEWQKEDTQLTEERKQAYLQAMKEMQESIDKAKADAATLDDKTAKLDEQITKTFSDLDTNIQNMHEQLQKEADRMNRELQDTKGALSTLRTDLQNAQLDNGRIHDELTNINGKFEHKVWQTDLDPLKAQIDRAETSVQQTKDELLGKASREDLDTVTNAVSKLDTQLKETAKGVEISVKKDELGGDVARLLNDKTNLLLGTRSFSGEDNWRNRDKVTIEPGYYKGMKTAAVQVTDASIYQPYRVKANTAYTFSFFGKEDRDNPKATLVIKPIDAQNVNVDGGEQQVHITTEWQRFAVTFSVDQECEISIQIIQGPEATNNILHLAGLKLQYGQNDTPWEPNEADVAENIEHTESQFNVYSDQIAGIVKKQEKMGDTERQLDTRITETAEGLKQTSKDLQDANGKITEFKGQLESTAHGLKTEYEKYTNDAVGQISDSTLNLIRNSSFQNKDSDFDQWQNISAKANVRSDENGLRWVELTQSGLTTNNPEGITSNYFNIKQGKVTVAVDIKSGDKASLDNDSVLSLELYNDVKKRVDFYDVSLSQLGLSKELLGDHTVHRGLYRLGIDRNDAKYMTVKAKLVKNGDLYFTNFSARLSSIDDGAYEPNPDDINQQILKQNTKIEQNAKEVAIKANSVDVTRDIKSAVQNSNGGGVNLLRGTSPEWKTLTGGIWFTQTTSTGPIEIGSLAPGDTVTYTITVRNNSQYAVYPEIIGYSDDSGTRAFGVKKDEGVQPGETKTVSMSAAIAENTIKIVAWLATNDPSAPTFSVDAKNEKLEKGSVATPWTPAYEDISTEIKSAKDAAIQVASDQINIHVNELTTSFDDKLNKRINEQKTASEKFTSDGIEQVVTKVTEVKNDVNGVRSKVDNLRVGTRNLLHHSDTFDGWIKGYSVNVTADKYLDGRIAILGGAGADGGQLTTFLDGPYNDDLVTWTVYAKADNAGDKMHTELWGGGGYNDQPLTTEWKKYKFSGHRNIDYPDFYLWGCVGNKGNIYVALPFAVVGNTIGTWSPNPGDINQTIKDATEYKAVTGTIDFNNLKTQQKIFYKDLQAANAPAGGNYWYYLDVEPGYDGRILQTAISDRDNITWVRTFVDNWSPWVKQADQRNVDDLNNQISSFKTETTASVKNLGDRVTTQVNSITKKVDTNNGGGVNLLKATDFSSTDLTKLKDVWGSNFTLRDGKAMQLDQLKGNGDLDATQFLPVEPDTDYTLSFESYYNTVASGGSYNNIYTFIVEYKDQNNTTPHYLDHMRVVANTADRSKNIQTIHTQKDCHYVQVFFRASAKTLFSFWRPKLERGSVATPWTPAPEDTSDAIKQLNTKWDVANGQIQGKVTETQVNNILNGKGYATQAWAQTMFQMRSDAITLQAVRDNITNGIQNQVNDTRNQINGLQNQFNTQTGINLLKGTADFSGPWFNKNDKGWSYSGEWQPPTSENKSERNNNVVYQDSGHAWDGLGQTVELDTGEYTFSMWMWPTLSGNESMNIYAGDSQYGGTAKVNYSGYSYSASQPQNRWILVKTYLTVTQGGKLSIRPELNQASGTIHVASYMLQHGHVENPVWAPAPDDLAPKSIISSINITPDQIKIASNKIVIDGNTDIHGVLRVPDVKLAGRSGNVDLSGDGINITKTNGAGINIASNGIQLTANTNGQSEIEGVITTAWSMNNKNQNGIGLVITPEQTLGRPYGGDILTIGEMVAPGTIHAGMVFDATGINPDYKKGFNWFAPHTLNGDGGVLRFPGAQDDLMLYPGNMPESRQSEYSQPTLRLVHGNSQSSAGIQFQWDDIVPFGRITSSMSYVSAVGTDDDGGITVSWYSYGAWYNGRKAPSIVYRGSDGNRGNGGIVFYPYGEVCFWQGDFHSNLRWSGMKNTD